MIVNKKRIIYKEIKLRLLLIILDVRGLKNLIMLEYLWRIILKLEIFIY